MVLTKVVVVIGAAFAGLYNLMLRGGNKNKKAGDRNPKGHERKKEDAAARRANASKQFFDKIKYKQDSILGRTNVYVSGTRCPTKKETEAPASSTVCVMYIIYMMYPCM